MKVGIKENPDTKETFVEIQCKIIDKDILKLERHICLYSKTLITKSAGDFVQIPVNEIIYIESTNRKTFVHAGNAVFETDFRLYELEDRLEDSGFTRASKSTIINLQQISVLTPEINRMLLATMKNGEKVYISRQYTKRLKETLLNSDSKRKMI